MKFSFVDAHCHPPLLTHEQQNDLFAGSDSTRGQWLCGGYDVEDWHKQLDLKNKYAQRLVVAMGIHPYRAIEMSDKESALAMEVLVTLLDKAELIGETGIDFSKSGGKENRLSQENLLRLHLRLQTDVPYVFHVVQAHGAVLDILKSEKPVRGFVHAFSGPIEVAKEYMNLGINLSIGPGVLDPNYKKLREALVDIPLECIHIESDAPWTPEKGQDPRQVLSSVAEEVAKIKNIPVAEVWSQTKENTDNLLKK